MDLDRLKNSWVKSKKRIEETTHFSKKEMETIIKKQTDKTTHRLSRIFLMGVAVQVMALLFQSVNLAKNSGSPDLVLYITVSILLMIPALYYSFNRWHELRSVDYESLSLAESLKKKIQFFKISYNKWLLTFAASYIILLWSINIFAGDFTSMGDFNLMYALVYGAVFLLIYFSFRFAHVRYLREYEISLNDLGGDQLTDLRKESLKFRRFKLILVIILSMALIAGVILAIR